MNARKLLCLVLALVLCGALAFAEESDTEDLQAQLDEANAYIAELEAEVELYKPYYDAQVIISYDGGIIFLEDVLEEYEYYEESIYSSYGISLSDYGLDTTYKEYAAETLLEDAVLQMHITELGLDVIDEETQADLEEEATEVYETYIDSIWDYFVDDDLTDEEVREDCIEYLDYYGYTEEYILEYITESYIYEALYDYIIADVTITEEEIQATFDDLVAEQTEDFASDYTYNTSRNNGETIVWNPEGYRAVKQVLIMFSDEQYDTYDELTETLDDLNDELEAIQAAAEEEEEEDEDEDTEDEDTEDEEEEEELRTEEEVQADIDAIQAELDALYEELLPTAEEVIEAFNSGTSFDDLIAEYNDDTGMTTEPTATIGYAVSADSTTWDSDFTEGAMSIENVGEISGAVYGENGIYIIYYMADIEAGEVDLETVREEIEASTLSTKQSETYSSTIEQWIEDVNPVYYYENLE